MPSRSDLDGGLGPWGGVGHQAGQFIHFVDGVAVEFGDDVTPLNTGLRRRRVGIDLGHQGSLGLGHPEGLGQFRGDDLHLDPDHAPDHLALFLQLRDHRLGHVAGDGKADALPPAMMAVLMPTTSPLRLSRGPPLLPGLMEASVWRKLS